MASVGHEGLEPGPGAAMMEVRRVIIALCCTLSPRLYCRQPLAFMRFSGWRRICNRSHTVWSCSAQFRTYRRNARLRTTRHRAASWLQSHLQVRTAHKFALEACRSSRDLFLAILRVCSHMSQRRVTRVVQAKATVDIVEVDGRPIAAPFQVC